MRRLLKIFLLPFFILLFSNTAMSQGESWESIKSNLISDWQRLKSYTLEYINVMPEEAMSFKPSPDSRSFAETMLHGAQANFIYASFVTNSYNPHPFVKTGLQQNDSFKTKAPLIKIMTEGFDFMISKLTNMRAEDLGKMLSWNQRTFSAEKYVRLAYEHQVHMTGQCVIYLKLKNIKVPEEKLF